MKLSELSAATEVEEEDKGGGVASEPRGKKRMNTSYSPYIYKGNNEFNLL